MWGSSLRASSVVPVLLVILCVCVCVSLGHSGAEDEVDDDSKLRIVGGSVASVGDFPAAAAIRVGSSVVCSGSLVSRTVVMTAAHCFQPGDSLSSVTVTVGRISLTDTSTGQVIGVSSFHAHPDYNYNINGSPYDIALLILSGTANVDGTNYNVAKFAESVPSAGSTSTSYGWGFTQSPQSPGATTSNELKKVNLPVVGSSNCNAGVNEFCQQSSSGQDSCNGDSGGPVVVDDLLAGLTSRGPADCGGGVGYPVATAVSPFISWAKSIDSSVGTGYYNSASSSTGSPVTMLTLLTLFLVSLLAMKL